LNLTVVYRPTNSIKPEPRNARTHSKKQVAEIAASIRQFGFALVTGASSGIGRASAKAFAKEGMRVAVSARPTDRLLELLKELGPEAIMLPADLTNPAETDELIHQAIQSLEGLTSSLRTRASILPVRSPMEIRRSGTSFSL
jgi:short chain dehydrogenase